MAAGKQACASVCVDVGMSFVVQAPGVKARSFRELLVQLCKKLTSRLV